jgi:AraC-like DNA-binding protein
MPPAAARPAQWSQRVGGLTAIPRLLTSLGADPVRVLADAGLPADALARSDAYLPYAAVVALLNRCAQATGCAHFGLLAGAEWRLEDLGLAGEAARHCATLGEGLETLTVCLRLNNQGAAAYVRTTGRETELGYAVFHPDVTAVAVAYDTVAVSALNRVRDLLGDPGWCPARVLLPRAAPADPRPYGAMFGCPMEFDADRAAVRLRASDLARALPGADAVRRTAALHEAETRLGEHFLPGVYASLRTLLLEGNASSDAVAAALAMHKRTLARRLAHHGTTFQTVLDEVRFEVARQMLRETERPIAHISAALGYAEPAAFTRSFRRWSGVSPREWRANPPAP